MLRHLYRFRRSLVVAADAEQAEHGEAGAAETWDGHRGIALRAVPLRM